MKRLFFVFMTVAIWGLSPQPTLAIAPDTSTIKSVTWHAWTYDTVSASGHIRELSELRNTIPLIKSVGFNAVWLVLPWVTYQPEASPNPTYNDQVFSELKHTLATLKENRMSAIIGLNYVWPWPGTQPKGFDDCSFITDPTMYQMFETYVVEFLGRIAEYSDNVYILVFTEGTEPWGDNCPQPVLTWKEFAGLLRPTLGSLPTRLPQELRSTFRIGYHDYSLINLGWSSPDSPIQDPISFDFVSMVNYNPPGNHEQVVAELDLRASRFKNLYPETPLIIGEMGTSSCTESPYNSSEDHQAEINSWLVSYALEKNYGFNLWGWNPAAAAEECTNPVIGGLGITRLDDSLKPSAYAVRDLLVPPFITNSGVNRDYNPWAIWAIGDNLASVKTATVYDGTNIWSENIPVSAAIDFSFVSFQLPSFDPPSGCKQTNSCQISYKLRTDYYTETQQYFIPLLYNLPGDIDYSGLVDFLDFNLLLTNYSISGQFVTDINSDDKVNTLDATIVLANFGKSL